MAKRYLEAGIEGLKDLPRSGQPLKLDPEKINEILILTTQRVPQEAAARPQTPSPEDLLNQQRSPFCR